MLSNHKLEDIGMVFPHTFRKFWIPSLNMVVCSFVNFCVDIPYVHGDLWIITKPVSTKYSLTVISCGNSSVGHTSKPSTPYGHQQDGDEIVNVPLSCYIVKCRTRKIAITGSSYKGKTPINSKPEWSVMDYQMTIVRTSFTIAFNEIVKVKLVFLLLFFLFTITSVQEINQWVWSARTAGPHKFQHAIVRPYPPLPIIVRFRRFGLTRMCSSTRLYKVHTLNMRLQSRVAGRKAGQV